MGSIMNSFKQGLGLGLGFNVSFIVFLSIGFLFFIPGYLLFKGEQNSDNKTSAKKIGGIVLMGIGVIIMGGFGFNFLIEGINDLVK
jgi:hypothetical protein